MNYANQIKPRYLLGQVLATPGALEALESNEQQVMELLQRHVALDPGELDQEDQQTNFDAVENGGRIFSSYLLKDGTKIWIITEADRSATTLLLPDEY